MVKILVELLEFMRSCAPLLFSLGFFTLFFVLLSKSVKKHATTYYIAFALPFLLYLVTFFGGLMKFEMPNLIIIPVLGEILRDYIHVGALGHPILVIIMYIGALDVKIPFVKKLMSIRKEISIISGFPILTHSLVRIVNNLPNSLKFFTNKAGYLENTPVVSELGAGISSFSFVLGIVLVIIYVPLWVTSFDSVRKRMGGAKWKKLQRWSYVLYALLIVHAIGIQIGGMLNPRAMPSRPAVETVAAAQGNVQGNEAANARPERSQRGERPAQQPSTERQGGQPQGQQVAQQTAGAQQPVMQRRAPSKGISDIQVSREMRQYIHIFSLFLIYGSYLYLRLRKARKDAEKKIRA